MNDNELMAVYGITSRTKTTYHVAGYRYDNLSDAVNYAKDHPETVDDYGELSAAPESEQQ